MWDIWELSQIPRAPHSVAGFGGDAWSDEQKLAFDRMILTFGRLVEAKKHETIRVKRDKSDDGMMDKLKYETLAQIFDTYDDTWGMTKFAQYVPVIPPEVMAEVLENAFADDVQF